MAAWIDGRKGGSRGSKQAEEWREGDLVPLSAYLQAYGVRLPGPNA